MTGGEMILPSPLSPEIRGTLPTPINLATASLREYAGLHTRGMIPLGRYALLVNALQHRQALPPDKQEPPDPTLLPFLQGLARDNRLPNETNSPLYKSAIPDYNPQDPYYGLRTAWVLNLTEMDQAKTPPTNTDIAILQQYLPHKEREAIFQSYPGIRTTYERVRGRRRKEKRLSRKRKIIAGLGITAIVLGGAVGIDRILKTPITLGGITTSAATVIPPDQIEASGMGDRPSQEQLPTEQVHPITPTIVETPLPTPAGIESPEPEKSDFLSKIYDMIVSNRADRNATDPDFSRRVETEMNRNRINICMVGLDDVEGVPHADAIIVASLNKSTKKTTVVRIPRDLHAPEIDDMLGDPSIAWRINGAYYAGGWDGVRKILEDATGLSQDFCFFYKFDGFRNYIEALGGIDVELDQQFIDNYSEIFATDYPGVPSLTPGKNHFNGELALWYSRVRKNDNDYYRGARQQQVIEATAGRLSWLFANAGENKGQLLNFIKVIMGEHISGNGVYAGEVRLDQLIALARLAINDPKSVDLSAISIEKFDPGWGDLITEGVLSSDPSDPGYWQLYPVGQSGYDPEDNLDYWRFLRDKIRERFLNLQGSAKGSRTTASITTSTDLNLNPAFSKDLSLEHQARQAQLTTLRNSLRARQQARASERGQLNRTLQQARVNIPRGRGGKM